MHAHAERGPLSRAASWCLVVGAILAVIGGIVIAVPRIGALAVDVVCGVALVTAGACQIGMSAFAFTWRGFWLTLLCGVLSMVTGTALLAIPVEGIHVLAVFVGIVILFEAAAKLAAAFSVPRDVPRGWLLIDGLVTALLGGILLASDAGQAATYLGILVGINLVSSGISLFATGLWLRGRFSP